LFLEIVEFYGIGDSFAFGVSRESQAYPKTWKLSGFLAMNQPLDPDSKYIGLTAERCRRLIYVVKNCNAAADLTFWGICSSRIKSMLIRVRIWSGCTKLISLLKSDFHMLLPLPASLGSKRGQFPGAAFGHVV
jgi:hypothetical protein